MSQFVYETHSQSGILLNANENPWNLPDSIRQEIKDALDTIAFNRYPDDSYQELCEAYSQIVHIPASQILAGNGSDQHLGFLIGTFLGKGKNLLTLSLDFGMYDYYASSYDAGIIKYPVDPFSKMDVDDFIHFMQDKDPDMVLFSNPNNPTGNFLGLAEIQRICDAASCPVVVDEAYIEFAQGSALSLLDRCDHLYVTRTLSKAYGLAGVRIGFLLSSQANMDALRPLHVPYAVNSISAKIGAIVLKHADLFDEQIENIKKERDRFAMLSLQRCRIKPSQANFILIQTPAIQALIKAFKENGLTIREYKGKDYCRVTIGTPEENQIVKDVLISFDKEEQ